jgi:signal transduction histidine kinase
MPTSEANVSPRPHVVGRLTSSVFVRLFIGFFTVSALVLVAAYYLTQRAAIPEDLLIERAPRVALDILHAFNSGGEVGLEEAHDRIRTSQRINAYLVRNGKKLGSRPMPDTAQQRMGELVPGREAHFRLAESAQILALPVQLASGDAAHVVALMHQQVDPASSRTRMLYWQLFAVLAAAALVGWLSALGLSAPIRRMQVAVNRVASGDLSWRIGNTIDTSVGELKALALDIDHMASQMQAMIAARDRLLHHLSHEMRSPLARLRILMELLRTDNSAGSSNRLDKADREIGRIDALVDEILTLARFDGTQVPAMESLSLRDIVDECVDSALVEAETKSIHLITTFSQVDAAFALSGNRELIVRAIDNLLRNAIRHTPTQGNVKISLEDNNQHITLTVSDAGPGVPDNLLNAIFEPFFRIPGQVQEAGQVNVGLGLTLVRLVANLHGATITAGNKTPHGLSIAITFSLSPSNPNG